MRLIFQLYYAMLSRLVFAILLPLNIALSVLLIAPNISAAERQCLDLFAVHSSHLEFQSTTKIQLVGLIQDGIDRLDLPLALLQKPKLVSVELPEILGEPAIYEPEYRLMRIRSFLLRDGYTESQVRAIAQHEYGHAVFFANMATYSPRWALWYRAINMDGLLGLLIYNRIGYKFRPGVAAEISSTYQEVFADLLAVIAEQNTEIVDSIERRYSEHTTGTRRFDGTAFDARWTERDFHDELAPVRSFLWSNYFSKDKNKDRTAVLLKKVFDVMARDIIARSKDRRLYYLNGASANLRLLNLLRAELTEFE